MIRNLIRNLFCKHEFKTLTNLKGDISFDYGLGKSMRKCVNCNKLIITSKYDNKCNIVNKV